MDVNYINREANVMNEDNDSEVIFNTKECVSQIVKSCN